MKRYELNDSSSDEIWRAIYGYEDYYEVSNLGRVRSKDRVVRQRCRGGGIAVHQYKGKILTPSTNGNYLIVKLHGTSGYKTCVIHKLVARTFIPNPDSLPQVNHKDENKFNNCVDNLEWCTAQYNNTYGTLPEKRRVRLRGEGNPRCKLSESDIRDMRKLRNEGKTCRELSELYDITPDSVYQIVTKRRWKHIE